MAVQKKVLIIGGGLSGMKTAQGLKGKAQITIVQAESFVEWQIAATWSVTHPEDLPKAVGPLEPSKLPGVTYVIGTVQQLKDNSAILSNGTALEFDYCVLCLGFGMPVLKPTVGMSWANRSEEVKRYGAAIKSAKCVVVVGGGPVGVELAGDAREVCSKDARVVLLVRGGVLTAMTEKYRKNAENKLKQLNIEVLVDSIDGDGEPSCTKTTLKLKSGRTLDADVVLPAYGRGPPTSFLQDSPGMLDASGFVIVNEFLQSTARPNVFAVGCSNLKEFVAVPKIEGQTKTVVANLESLMSQKSAATKHNEGAPFMKAPAMQVIGHDTFALLDTSNAPPPLACCARMGFPCCPPPCCWCCCGPCCCGGPCADPQGLQMAKFAKSMLHKSAGFNGIKLGQEPAAGVPAQQTM
eukprot:gnl/TRDRNA2_/TRDRNA2_180237_c0_seq1.p1 gnl/TRDRNA2_/TRDRNA2_180237_c0~~gnl/TRDRNA2_/TRDRNA2_180237_c0_seq1.p1  ORF type:complete len:408 (+),score=82.74 gnl/TRDRNA2_/TRDRNA2_180237_c0_seq1:84-1307(+)